LLESEYSGHEKERLQGQSHSASAASSCQSRTVFLDEVGEIPLIAAQLLRVLQERECERLGELTAPHHGSSVDRGDKSRLASMVDEQKFRSDLFYRLNVFHSLFACRPCASGRKIFRAGRHFTRAMCPAHEQEDRDDFQ